MVAARVVLKTSTISEEEAEAVAVEVLARVEAEVSKVSATPASNLATCGETAPKFKLKIIKQMWQWEVLKVMKQCTGLISTSRI